jgi:predicted metal-binding membrane protein
MQEARIDPISTQRNIILGLLVVMCAGAWALLAWQGMGMHQHLGSPMASPTMGMEAPLFVAMWMAMTVAMMFPIAAPMLLTFHKTQGNYPPPFSSRLSGAGLVISASPLATDSDL